MITSSLRKWGIAGISAALLISGLTTSVLNSQAATTDATGSIQLLQSPAAGSLLSLGGIPGYINSQSGGDINGWLTRQGVDPNASGVITDSTIPSDAQGTIKVQGSTVSVAPAASQFAPNVNVGYLVADAKGTETLNLSVSNLAISPGHESDSHIITWSELGPWLNGTVWSGNYNYNGLSFSFKLAWSAATGATITPNPNNDLTTYVAGVIQSGLNNPDPDEPDAIHLSDVITAVSQYSSTSTADVPYSFAYDTNGALSSGSSVTVNTQDVVSDSWLKDFNVNGAQVSGPLSSLPMSSLLPNDVSEALSGLEGFSDYSSTTLSSDVVAKTIADAMAQGKYNTWASSFLIAMLNSSLTSTSSDGVTFKALDSTAQSKIKANTAAAMAQFAQGDLPNMIAQGTSATLTLNASFAPGSVTSLTPTGVTAYTAPIEVDTQASTLTLSSSSMPVGQNPACWTEVPSVTATATVIDATGQPVKNSLVTFTVDSSAVSVAQPIVVTNSDGVATTTIVLEDGGQSVVPGVTTVNVGAHVDFSDGADLNAAQLSFDPVTDSRPVSSTLSVVPTNTSSARVVADGQDSYTAEIALLDACGRPTPAIAAEFSVTGSALLSQTSLASGQDGVVKVTLTDTVAEPVTVTVHSDGLSADQSVDVTFSEVPLALPIPSVTSANATQITGRTEPSATINVTTVSDDFLGMTTADSTGYWSIATLADTTPQWITVVASNSLGAVSPKQQAWLDTARPDPARIDRANDIEVAGDVGAAEAYSTVTVVFPDGTSSMAEASENGSYSVVTPASMLPGLVTVTVTDEAGNVSDPTTMTLSGTSNGGDNGSGSNGGDNGNGSNGGGSNGGGDNGNGSNNGGDNGNGATTSLITATARYTSVQAAGSQIIIGTNFRPLERVTMTCSICSRTYTGLADRTGHVAVSFLVPSGTAAGDYTATLTGPTSGSVTTSTFSVTAPAMEERTSMWVAYWTWVAVFIQTLAGLR